jgi:hypothetical protein
VKALTRANIISDVNEPRDMALYYFKASKEFNKAVRKWENISAAEQMWTNIKTFISAQYACKNKQNELITKQFKVNLMEEQAEATEELIAILSENHTNQMEALIKNTMDAMKKMMKLIKNEAKTPSNPTELLDKEKKKKGDEKRKWYNEVPICTLCRKKHPLKKEDECWELEKNKELYPNTWKLSKST